MFAQLFKGPRAVARHRNCPLAEQRLRYLTHCAESGMARRTLRNTASTLLAITDYLRLGDRPDALITPTEIEAQAALWASNSRNTPPRCKRSRAGRARFISRATHWLQFLGRWQAPAAAPRPHANRIAAFADYMRRERGLSPCTITGRCQAVQGFLERLCRSQPRLEEVTPAHLDSALAEKLQQRSYARVTVQDLASALRAFFRYAEAQGWCRHGLSEAIQAPRVFAQEDVPVGPCWADVQRLLALTEGDAPAAIRDRAILLLLSVYGCRSGEVIRLRLEDLDWQQELIHFTRAKGARVQTYPLSRVVGDALLRYLREVRPRSSYREVFLRLLAPAQPLQRSALWWVVGHRLRALGIKLRHQGPHSLRHACATHLLEQGFTLKQIGDHLGHRRPDTTRIYAKVDLVGLRHVADFDLGDLL